MIASCVFRAWYSASEAASALNYLALAGYDADEACAALPQVLALAQAGGLDLAYASDLATDAMAALGLSMDQLSNFSDQMAVTAQKSNTSVARPLLRHPAGNAARGAPKTEGRNQHADPGKHTCPHNAATPSMTTPSLSYPIPIAS